VTDFPEFYVEPNWKELAQRYRTERDEARKENRELRKQVAELTKKVSDGATEIPFFGVIPLRKTQ
jgi:hypothetical protein